jgi:hypothetical protein
MDSLQDTLDALRAMKHALDVEDLAPENSIVVDAVCDLDLDLLILLCEGYGQELIDILNGKKKA